MKRIVGSALLFAAPDGASAVLEDASVVPVWCAASVAERAASLSSSALMLLDSVSVLDLDVCCAKVGPDCCALDALLLVIVEKFGTGVPTPDSGTVLSTSLNHEGGSSVSLFRRLLL